MNIGINKRLASKSLEEANLERLNKLNEYISKYKQ